MTPTEFKAWRLHPNRNYSYRDVANMSGLPEADVQAFETGAGGTASTDAKSSKIQNRVNRFIARLR